MKDHSKIFQGLSCLWCQLCKIVIHVKNIARKVEKEDGYKDISVRYVDGWDFFLVPPPSTFFYVIENLLHPSHVSDKSSLLLLKDCRKVAKFRNKATGNFMPYSIVIRCEVFPQLTLHKPELISFIQSLRKVSILKRK